MTEQSFGDITVRIYRYGFRPGYYAEARNAAGERLAYTGVFSGKGGKQKAIRAALEQAKTGRHSNQDCGCPG